MAAAPVALSDLISKLTTSLETASHTLPDADSATPPNSGISLMDVKSELFVSYLQNLAFLILIKLRHTSRAVDEESHGLSQDVVRKLVELRVYLEKGVRPLENKLKYQIGKVLRAADTAERHAASVPGHKSKAEKQTNGLDPESDSGGEGSNGDDSDKASDNDEESSQASVDDLAYRPNPAAFTNGVSKPLPTSKSSAGAAKETAANRSSEVYRPPRITPTALPTIATDDKRRPSSRKPQRSHTIDDYIASEMSAAPLAEPSIGSTITAGGRRVKSAKEQREEDERTAYEEANFIRLPGPSKKDRAKMRGKTESGFGGEELRGLGQGLDRIGRLTNKRKTGGGRDIADGPRGEGFETFKMRGKRRRM